MGFAVFEGPPSSAEVQQFFGRAIRTIGALPKYLITDHGTQFTDDDFRQWCDQRRIRQRFGAVGKCGSLAVVERFIRTMKNEGTQRFLVSANRAAFQRELDHLAAWYNGDRPHTALDAATPDEIYYGKQSACVKWRFEPRSKWPRGAPCAAPDAPVRGRPGTRLEVNVRYRAGRKHLPIVTVRRVA
jgi:hypothetical protein